MKKRIRVAAIIRDDDKILVLKRSRGRTEAPVFWELPTGKIKFGEQPEEALYRTLEEYLKATPLDLKLKDVITFVAPEGASRLDNLYIIYEARLKSKPEPVERYSAYKYVNDSSSVHLDGASIAVLEIENGKIISNRLSHRSTASSYTVYVDGASRGNPGPSGIGCCIRGATGEIVERGGKFIGFTTARSAEYFAMKYGIERALSLGLKSVQFVSDSLMVVNQLSGVMKPKNPDILPTFNAIQKLLENFEAVSFTHVPREENQVADEEANLAIDNILKT